MTTPTNPAQALEGALRSLQADWEAALTNPKLTFKSEIEWAVQSIIGKDSNLKVALANPRAAEDAVMNIAAIGVSLNPAKKFAYILPRDGKLVLDISYMGLIDIAISSGSIEWAQARRVYTSHTFELRGLNEAPIHKYDPFAKREERGEVRGAFVCVKTTGGDYLTNPMGIEDIEAIRARSPSWKAHVQDKNKSGGPWQTDPEEMEKKTCVKNAYKYWPRSDRLDQAVHYLNTDGGQGIELEGDAVKAMRDHALGLVAACNDSAALSAVWTAARTNFKEADDHEGIDLVRKAIEARGKALGLEPKPKTNGTPTSTPAPAPKQSPEDEVLAKIRAAKNFDEVEATGPLIDALPEYAHGPLNLAYNERLEELKKAAK